MVWVKIDRNTTISNGNGSTWDNERQRWDEWKFYNMPQNCIRRCVYFAGKAWSVDNFTIIWLKWLMWLSRACDIRYDVSRSAATFCVLSSGAVFDTRERIFFVHIYRLMFCDLWSIDAPLQTNSYNKSQFTYHTNIFKRIKK